MNEGCKRLPSLNALAAKVKERERERQTDRQTHRQTETDRDRQRQTETDKERQRQTETDRESNFEDVSAFSNFKGFCCLGRFRLSLVLIID